MLYKEISKPNEFSTHLKKVEDFVDFERRANQRFSDGKPFDVVIGKTEEGEEEIQGYKYDARFWTKNQAKKHCSKENGIDFITAIAQKKYTDIRKIPNRIKKLPENAQIVWLFAYNKKFGETSNSEEAENFAKEKVMFFFERKGDEVGLKKEFSNKPIEYLLHEMKG